MVFFCIPLELELTDDRSSSRLSLRVGLEHGKGRGRGWDRTRNLLLHSGVLERDSTRRERERV